MPTKFSDFAKFRSETVITWNYWKMQWFHETTWFHTFTV